MESEETTLVFRKPLATRMFMAALGLLVAGMLPIRLAVGYSDPARLVPLSPGGWVLFGVLEVILLLFGAALLGSAGPEDLFLDRDRHTYRFVFGWPLRPQARQGPWEDMAGVYVWQHPSHGAYYVGIAWKDDAMRLPILGRRPTWLGSFHGPGRWDRADRLAAEVAAALGLPIIEPPFPKRRVP